MTQPITDSMSYVADVDQPGFHGNHVQPGERTYEIVRAWHNDTHTGTFRFCDQQPCHAINRPPA